MIPPPPRIIHLEQPRGSSSIIYGRMLRRVPLGCNSVLQERGEPQRARDTREAEDKKWEDGPANNDSRGEKRRDGTRSQPCKSAIRQRLRPTLGKCVGDSLIIIIKKSLIKCTHQRKDVQDAPKRGRDAESEAKGRDE